MNRVYIEVSESSECGWLGNGYPCRDSPFGSILGAV